MLPIVAFLAIGWIIIRRPVRAWLGHKHRRIKDVIRSRREARRVRGAHRKRRRPA